MRSDPRGSGIFRHVFVFGINFLIRFEIMRAPGFLAALQKDRKTTSRNSRHSKAFRSYEVVRYEQVRYSALKLALSFKDSELLCLKASELLTLKACELLSKETSELIAGKLKSCF